MTVIAPPARHTPRVLVGAVVAAAAVCFSALNGCGPVIAGGVIAQRAMGPAKVPARYEFPSGETVLVLVENYRNPDAAEANAEQVSRYVIENLRENLKPKKKDDPVPAEVIDPAKVYDLRGARPAEFRKMKVSEIGRAVGADQVVYVDLQYAGAQSTIGSDLLRATFAARVKVIDVRTGRTRWPSDTAEGFPVFYESKPQRPGDTVYPLSVRDEALREGGKRIARLFYTWKPADDAEAAGQ